MEILYKSKNAVVIYKPPYLSSQSDNTGEDDAMSLTSSHLREMGESSKLWLVHRLDKVVGGLMIFARNQAAAAELSKIVANGLLCKEYLAITHGKAPSGLLEDYLFKDSAGSKAYVVNTERRGAKHAKLEAIPIAHSEESGIHASLVHVRLHTGRFHQIRAQLSSRGASIIGDKKYGSRDRIARTPALFAMHLSINLFGENIDVKLSPNTEEYPWSLFKAEIASIIN